MRLALAVLALALGGPLAAQPPQAPPGAEILEAGGRKKKAKEEPAPLALALDLAFGATLWAQVRISTAGPVSDLTKLVGSGHYKLELIELVLMSAEGRRALKDTVKKRKEGAKLSEIAKDYRLDYEKIYEAALAVEELVDRDYLPRFPEKRPRKESEEP